MNKFLIIVFLFYVLSAKLFATPNLQARTGILIDFDSDEILFECDDEYKWDKAYKSLGIDPSKLSPFLGSA